jgi:hypothetical protein
MAKDFKKMSGTHSASQESGSATTLVERPALELVTSRHPGGIAGDPVDRDRIAARAYELYMERGGGEGQALDDWLSAEREVIGGRE